MNTEFPRWKIIEQPLLPIGSSAIDALPVVMLFLLLGMAVYGATRAARPGRLRWIVRITSFLVFVVFLHRCLCAIRGWAFGLRFIARDDMAAFNMLCVILPLIASSLVAGRIFCGWICPLGFIQDLLHRLGKRIPGRRSAAYSIVALAVIAVLMTVTRPAGVVWEQSTAAIWGVALSGVMVAHAIGGVPDGRLKKLRVISVSAWTVLAVIGVFVTNPWCVMVGGELDYSSIIGAVAVMVAVPLVPLAWCRYLCPLGALLALPGRRALIAIRRSRDPQASCPMDAKELGSCILCRECGGRSC